MKASELIAELAEFIADKGDILVYYACDPGCHVQVVEHIGTSTREEDRYAPEGIFSGPLPDLFIVLQ